MSGQTQTRYQIDDLILDTHLGTLRRGDEEIALPQLSYLLLCELVEQAPAIISQDELMNRVWGEQIVSDETLKQRIKLLRQALNDTPQAPRYIESVRGRGYRCVADVQKQRLKTKPSDDSINLKLHDRLPINFFQPSGEYWRLAGFFLLMTATVLAVVLSVNLLRTADKTPAIPTPKSAQVLQTDRAKAAYDKGRTFYLRYQPMDNEMAIKSYLKATELDPNYALAYAGLADAYAQGVFQFSGEPSWRKLALDAAFEAVMLDDTLAQNYKSLGNAHYVNGHLSQSLSANLKAVALDSGFIEAQASLGYIYSERGELKNALARHLNVLAQDWQYSVNWFHVALTLHRLGLSEKAKSWYQYSQEHQPNYHLATYHYSHLLMQTGKEHEALALLKQAENRSPDSANVVRGLVDYYLLNDSFEQAAPWFHKLALISGSEGRQYAQLLSIMIDAPTDTQALQQWYDKYARQYDERPFHSVQLAMAASGLKKPQAALRHLTEAVELGWLSRYFIEHLAFFDPLQQDPKFAKLIQFIERKQLAQRQQVDSAQLLKALKARPQLYKNGGL